MGYHYEYNDAETLRWRIEGVTGKILQYEFKCPACNFRHVFNVDAGKRHVWIFDGNTEVPTFKPSLKMIKRVGVNRTKHICHLYVRKGKIKFLNDSTHHMAGKTVDLPKME